MIRSGSGTKTVQMDGQNLTTSLQEGKERGRRRLKQRTTQTELTAGERFGSRHGAKYQIISACTEAGLLSIQMITDIHSGLPDQKPIRMSGENQGCTLKPVTTGKLKALFGDVAPSL